MFLCKKIDDRWQAVSTAYRISDISICVRRAGGFVVCWAHAQQLGGESPLANLMEVKAL